MHPPEPNFKMRERTVPAEELNDERKYYSSYVGSLYPFMLPAYEGPEDKEDYPEEMYKNGDVCGYAVEHVL